LDDSLNQAENIRRAALVASQGASATLAREALIGVKRTLDPNGILNPGVTI
jgi:FAD/FMN-containing dehydrogenase